MVAKDGYVNIREILTKQCPKCGSGFISGDDVREVERTLYGDKGEDFSFTVKHFYHEDCAKVQEGRMEEIIRRREG